MHEHGPTTYLRGASVCQGCEYRLYKDTMAQAPSFFERVDQIVLEVHLSRRWAADDATVIEYGRLLALLARSGHVLRHAQSGFCSGGEVMGVTPLVRSSGYLRRPGGHCENLVFARERITSESGGTTTGARSSVISRMRDAMLETI